MKPEHAVRVCQDLRKNWRGPRAPNDLSVEIIDDAGHFVFIDQPVRAGLLGGECHAVVPPCAYTHQGAL